MTISTRRFCGSRTPSAVCTSRPASPRPIDRDGRRRHTLADQSVLDGIRTTQRQRHVVGFRARRVGVAGRRDAGVTLRLEGGSRLLDRVQGLGRQVRAVPIEEHHERRRRHHRSRRRRRRRRAAPNLMWRLSMALTLLFCGLSVSVYGEAAQRARVAEVGSCRAVVTAFQVETERLVDVPAHAEDALIGELRALLRGAESACGEERDTGAGADIGDDRRSREEVIVDIPHDGDLVEVDARAPGTHRSSTCRYSRDRRLRPRREGR